MSYRSIKRVLGETSLERKCLLLFGICLLTLITSGFCWYSSRTDAIVQDATRRTAAGLTTTILFRQHLRQSADKRYEELQSAARRGCGRRGLQMEIHSASSQT